MGGKGGVGTIQLDHAYLYCFFVLFIPHTG